MARILETITHYSLLMTTMSTHVEKVGGRQKERTSGRVGRGKSLFGLTIMTGSNRPGWML